MGLFVKFLVFVLIGSALWSWGLFAEKMTIIKIKEALCKSFEKEYTSGEVLDKIYNRLKTKPVIHSPYARIFFIGMKELKKSNISFVRFQESYAEFIKQNIRTRTISLVNGEKVKIVFESKGGINTLASIASLSPFVGIVGSVWNIINVFKDVAAVKTVVSLSDVLPGIAESLFPIVVGLLVCIPAIYFYNTITTKLNRFAGELEIFSLEVANTLSRELDIISIKQCNDELDKKGGNLPSI